MGKFAEGYTGLTLTNTTLKYPSASVPEYSNGQKCAPGTPDAGKAGEVQARWWVLTTQTGNNQTGADRRHHDRTSRPTSNSSTAS